MALLGLSGVMAIEESVTAEAAVVVPPPAAGPAASSHDVKKIRSKRLITLFRSSLVIRIKRISYANKFVKGGVPNGSSKKPL